MHLSAARSSPYRLPGSPLRRPCRRPSPRLAAPVPLSTHRTVPTPADFPVPSKTPHTTTTAPFCALRLASVRPHISPRRLPAPAPDSPRLLASALSPPTFLVTPCRPLLADLPTLVRALRTAPTAHPHSTQHRPPLTDEPGQHRVPLAPPVFPAHADFPFPLVALRRAASPLASTLQRSSAPASAAPPGPRRLRCSVPLTAPQPGPDRLLLPARFYAFPLDPCRLCISNRPLPGRLPAPTPNDLPISLNTPRTDNPVRTRPNPSHTTTRNERTPP
jgi:hypothetical protein